jgi:hypothetical protein
VSCLLDIVMSTSHDIERSMAAALAATGAGASVYHVLGVQLSLTLSSEVPMPTVLLLVPLLLASVASAGEQCVLQGTQWLQDGALLGAVGGPSLARSMSSPELLAAQVELSGEPAGARVVVEDSVGRVDAWMGLGDLRLRAGRPVSFADDTIYTGQAILRIRAVEAAGVEVTPMDLPVWIEPSSTPRARVACEDLHLVEGWPGNLRPLAVGDKPRGRRVFLVPGGHVELSRIPGTSAALTLHPQEWTAVEAVSDDASAVRILVPFDGGIVVGWVAKDAVADEREPVEVAEPSGPAPYVAPPMNGEVKTCKKGAALWASAGGQDFILGTLDPGTGVVLGEKQGDRVEVLGVPSARSWAREVEATWWLDSKAARGCK